MKKLLIYVFLLSIGCSVSQAQSSDNKQASRKSAESEVLKAVDKFYDAFLAGDVETVKRMTAEDYLQTDVNGNIQDKSAWLAEYYLPIVERMKTGKWKWDVFERKDIQVRRYGNVAVLIGRTTFKFSDDAKASEIRFTQVWVKRHGNWQRAVYHNAWLPEPSQNPPSK